MMFLLEWNLSIKLNDHSLLDVYFYESVCSVHTHTHTQARAHAHTHAHTHICIYTFARVCMFVCVCVCVRLLDFLPYCVAI